jgi:hypothetical protein
MKKGRDGIGISQIFRSSVRPRQSHEGALLGVFGAHGAGSGRALLPNGSAWPAEFKEFPHELGISCGPAGAVRRRRLPGSNGGSNRAGHDITDEGGGVASEEPTPVWTDEPWTIGLAIIRGSMSLRKSA